MNKWLICLLPFSVSVNANCTLQGDIYDEGAKLGNLVCLNGSFTSADKASRSTTTPNGEGDLVSRNGIHVSASLTPQTDNSEQHALGAEQ
ncbi:MULTISPECIES: hypothetical protein [unclassified Agarivorans]|uniref:hypothetical protein n=1 Tax=unclassified Agarivorans TaxID=2636026 RepID=UPI0010EC8F07|nr:MULTISPECIES: hypothetical protein [unclassified Agarivorans]MDO6762685.1 hypothetical protein [Agarivorans sp. 1_MG-2023]GDY24779.1 hypothetical protein AHAT_06690 [Agarivorans sp. Toyoura001]